METVLEHCYCEYMNATIPKWMAEQTEKNIFWIFIRNELSNFIYFLINTLKVLSFHRNQARPTIPTLKGWYKPCQPHKTMFHAYSMEKMGGWGALATKGNSYGIISYLYKYLTYTVGIGPLVANESPHNLFLHPAGMQSIQNLQKIVLINNLRSQYAKILQS